MTYQPFQQAVFNDSTTSHDLNIPPLDLNADFLNNPDALKQSDRSSDFDEEADLDNNTNEIKAVNLLLPTTTKVDEAKNFLLESLGAQVSACYA